MHIVIISSRSGATRELRLSRWHLAAAMFAFASLVFACAWGVAHWTPARAMEREAEVAAVESPAASQFVRENLDAMAVRVGQLQAELIRLNTLGERLGALVGIKPAEFKATPAAQGGPLVAPSNLSARELQSRVDELSRQLSLKDDYFSVIENEMFDRRLREARLPSSLPVAGNSGGANQSSNFGWRIDPFTGQQALHEGVDFMADEGTPILAAAAGVVRVASTHPQFGNLIEIDHGHGIATRYAHASRLLVAEGALVHRGEKIAEVGTTGRSTGPHLHFEVRVNGVAQNPERFLAQVDAKPQKSARR